MGLDVTTYYCEDRATAKAVEEQHEKFTEAAWAKYEGIKYEDMTQAQKDECRKACDANALELGLTGEYESHPSVQKIELDSTKYPEHMFKIGYMRSSYNEGGINSVMRKLGLSDLYAIFNREDGDEYEFTPDWSNVLERTKAAIDGYQKHLGSVVGDVIVTRFDFNPFFSTKELPSSEEAVLEIVKKELERKPDNTFGGGYSSKGGHFFLGEHSMDVIAVCVGTHRRFMGTLTGNPDRDQEPCFYVAYRQKRKEGEKDWYLQALEIVQETAEYILAQPHPEHYYVHWSA